MSSERRQSAGAVSAENLETVRRGYAAWNRGDIDGWLATLDPAVEFTTSGLFPDFDEAYSGHEGLARFHREMLDAWEYFHLDPREMIPRGDGVAVEIHFHGRGARSGVEVELDFGHALRLRDGLVIEVASRETLAEAVEAIGLRRGAGA